MDYSKASVEILEFMHETCGFTYPCDGDELMYHTGEDEAV